MMITGAGGVSLSVRVTGDPKLPTLVCVHGYPDDSTIWDGVIAELSDRFRIVTYDVRGAGQSDKPRRRRDYRLDVLEADFTSVLDAISPDRPVHLLAHDWGAIQSWQFVSSERLTGRVASFTSISGPCLDHMGYRLRTRPRGPMVLQTFKSWYMFAFQLPLLPELVVHTLGRLAIAGLRRTRPSSKLPSSQSLPDYLHGINLYRANFVPRLLRPQPRYTDIPVQVIAPTGDLFIGPALQHDVSRWAPRLTTRTVQGGHWLPRTHASEIAWLVTGHADRADLAA